MSMHFYWFVLGVLCVWRVTHLFNAEDGPWSLMVRLRRQAGHGFWGELLDCFYCLSLWVAAPLAIVLGSGVKQRLFLWPALSAGAILLERATAAKQAGVYFEDQEAEHVLRKEQANDERGPTGSDAVGANAGGQPQRAAGHSSVSVDDTRESDPL